MRKRVLTEDAVNERRDSHKWLDVTEMADVEVSSEEPANPVESIFLANGGRGWRASRPGPQVIRLLFAEPQNIRHIRLEFIERSAERNQEFALYYSASQPGEPLKELRRQQWTFSPQGSTEEIEEYQVDLQQVSTLQLTIDPDRGRNNAVATLERWYIA